MDLAANAKKDLLNILDCLVPIGHHLPKSLHSFNKTMKHHELKTTHFELCSLCHSEMKGKCTNDTCEMQSAPVPVENVLSFYIMDVESQLRRIILGEFYIILQFWCIIRL